MNAEESREGQWRPAVPLPLYLLFHVRCNCGRRFWGWRIQVKRGAASERYARHYRAAHIHPLPSGGYATPDWSAR